MFAFSGAIKCYQGMYFMSLLPVPLRFEQTLFRRTVKDIELQLDVHYSPKVVACFKGHLACDDTLPPRHQAVSSWG